MGRSKLPKRVIDARARKRRLVEKYKTSGFMLPPGDLSEKQIAFLFAYAECGSISRAAKAAKTTASSVSAWRERSPAFERAFKAAKEFFGETLVAEAVRRGRDGWDEPVFQGGKLVGHKRKYSDRLLIKLLEANHPDYGDAGSGPMVHIEIRDPYDVRIGDGRGATQGNPEGEAEGRGRDSGRNPGLPPKTGEDLDLGGEEQERGQPPPVRRGGNADDL